MIPVILSGGSGSRLWPRSRREYPKQFLSLGNPASSLIQETVRRLEGLEVEAPIVVCNEQHRFMVAEQLLEANTPPQAILLEPFGRNTAPAITLAALRATAQRHDCLLLVLPADHVIGDSDRFREAVAQAVEPARAGRLVTFGIVPARVETGYGYIQRGPAIGGSAYGVARFVEKPDAATAAGFLDRGDYLWNSGMFLLSARRFLDEIEKFSPATVDACRRALAAAEEDRDFTWLDRSAFGDCPGESVDCAVMEKTGDAAVIPLDATWSDIGSWQSLWEVKEKDGHDNVRQGNTLAIDSRNCLIFAEKRLVATLGVDNLVVVDSDDALLVAARDRAQDVREIVAALEARGGSEHLCHRKVFRPWGHYDAIDSGERFQVKRIHVKPGCKLSLQMHHHRAEHWIVVKGTALVTRGEERLTLTENQSTFIPLGTVHRLENPGREELEIIEVQSGSYLGEDDIVRFEDAYGRAAR